MISDYCECCTETLVIFKPCEFCSIKTTHRFSNESYSICMRCVAVYLKVRSAIQG